MDADTVSNVTKSNKKRPNGTDISRYKNINNWSYRKWAWEFLRRNTAFIAACKSVRDGGDIEKQEIADRFGLKVFKVSNSVQYFPD